MVVREPMPMLRKPWPAGMPDGWAYLGADGLDTAGFYANTVAHWATVPAAFKAKILARRTMANGVRGVEMYAAPHDYIEQASIIDRYSSFGYSGLKGIAWADSYRERCVLLQTDPAQSYWVRHELGHIVDYSYNSTTGIGPLISNDSVMVALYAQIQPILAGTVYAKTNSLEWFAEFFSRYVANDYGNYPQTCGDQANSPGAFTVQTVQRFNQLMPGWDPTGVAPTITSPTTLPNMHYRTPYSYQFTGTGSSAGKIWSLTASTLPTGFALDGAGNLSISTFTTVGTYTFTVAVCNSAGAATQDCTITVTT